MEYKVTDIEWDTDGESLEDLDLSTEMTVEVPDGTDDVEEYISDELSNITGFLSFWL